MFSDESRFSLQSDSRRTLIWRAPGTRYYQENTIERHRYGGVEWLVWGGIILDSRTYLHVQSVTIAGHIYRDVILKLHVRLFRGTMGAEFLFMDDNARPQHANIANECLQSEDIFRMDWPAYSPDLSPIEHVWDMLGRRIAARQTPPTVYRNFGGHCLISGIILPKIRLIIRHSACLGAMVDRSRYKWPVKMAGCRDICRSFLIREQTCCFNEISADRPGLENVENALRREEFVHLMPCYKGILAVK
ncbi:transposable element Tcb1 transposase [Trichonephila clavipes]|nr:transposable element Tcb1 transposase [Trichonephila clavipes]